MQMALSQRRSMSFNSAIPSIIMLLPRETSKPSRPAGQRARRGLAQRHPPGDVLERHQHRPEPRVKRPDRIARRMRNARVERAHGQFARIFQRQVRRQRQVIADPDHQRGDRKRQPVNPAEQRRHRAGRRRAATVWCGGGRSPLAGPWRGRFGLFHVCVNHSSFHGEIESAEDGEPPSVCPSKSVQPVDLAPESCPANRPRNSGCSGSAP